MQYGVPDNKGSNCGDDDKEVEQPAALDEAGTQLLKSYGNGLDVHQEAGGGSGAEDGDGAHRHQGVEHRRRVAVWSDAAIDLGSWRVLRRGWTRSFVQAAPMWCDGGLEEFLCKLHPCAPQ